ncbi:Phosphoglycerol transferase MdoB [Paenibacillus uliginis N3/975]|uniref:Phosphoglycerol transferase MdoB n=1 Tax=Paenibacillus uliginis N3/975 TaxID=1313296 RepID=A0A1X7HGB8_9BACL|nr:LTA synthase family protein [Paenibacillus uliginis]SMF86075.1 Phosphoglycerol transferase MdoB [Paenibacillus uliginis N3/975]
MERTWKQRAGLFSGVFLLLLLKLMLLRLFLFNEVMWGKVPTDAFSLLVLMSFLELLIPMKRRHVVYWVFNLVVSLILFASAIYNVYFGSIPTYTALSGLGQVHQVRSSITTLLEPEHFIFFADVLVMAVFWIVNRFRRRNSRSGGFTTFTQTSYRGSKRISGWKLSMAGLLILGVVISGLSIRKAWGIENELVRAEHMGFMNYQVAAVVKSGQENRALAEGNLQDTIKEIKQLQESYPYREAKKEGQPSEYFGVGKGKNLIVVQMESLQNFPIHQSLDNQVLTPIMNQLADEGLYFPYVFQQIGQGNTSDAEFLSNTSIYPLGSVAMSTGFGSRELPSLPRMLSEQGYVSNTFHVNEVSFWDRNKMYPALAFDHFYDKPYFTNDHFNSFGPSDEELYRVGIEKLSNVNKDNKPFYAQFVTVSSHSPFTVPENFSKINIPSDLKGTQLGNYLDSVNYSDYALGKLIESLKQNGLWEDTVLVVYGDHFGINSNDTDPSLITSSLGVPYHERISRFNIPFIVHIPGLKEGKTIEQVGGQVDMMPTIANIMGISLKNEQFTAMGQDLLNIDKNVFGMRYYLPTGSFFNNEVMFVPGDGFEDGTAVSLKTLQPVQDISPYRDDYDYVLKLMKLSDEYVKLLPQRAP